MNLKKSLNFEKHDFVLRHIQHNHKLHKSLVELIKNVEISQQSSKFRMHKSHVNNFKTSKTRKFPSCDVIQKIYFPLFMSQNDKEKIMKVKNHSSILACNQKKSSCILLNFWCKNKEHINLHDEKGKGNCIFLYLQSSWSWKKL